MQIDFHHGVVYVIARSAGFGHREAETVAYCSQYVDDATNSGIIHFDNGAIYNHISSAHQTLDYRNFKELANHHVWIPFHFLPGNGGIRSAENPEGSFINKIFCRPNSYVSQDMVRACIEDRNALYGLHRLGITMHVYADTWAHQGFAGVIHQMNDIQIMDDGGRIDTGFIEQLKGFFGGFFNQATSKFVGGTFPLGHGAALSYPDRPYLKWNYKDNNGISVKRNNPRDFPEAANELCKVIQRYRVGDADANVPGLPADDQSKITEMLTNITDEKGGTRHKKWLKAIGEGYFSFPPVKLEYRAKGTGSWKHQALGTRKSKDKKSETFPYDPSFLRSDWKLFHDALQAHRFEVIHDILPRYGICAA